MCFLNQVLKFWISFYSAGLEYNTFNCNCYRSSISACYDKLVGVPIGQNEKVCKIEVFNKRPIQSKCTFVLDASIVVNFMSGTEDNEKLTVKLLSLKLATLITLLSSERASDTSYLDVNFITFKRNFVVLYFNHVTNSSKKGKKAPYFELLGFREDKLCIIKCLKTYLSVTMQYLWIRCLAG